MARLLQTVSLLYLTLPWFIFAVGWLRPTYAACVVVVLSIALTIEVRRCPTPGAPDITLRSLLCIALLAVAWATLSGAGGYGYQNIDWFKHNQLLKDLTKEHWPADYVVLGESGSRAVPLTYYVAYYLPAAAIGKQWGWAAANHALFTFSVLGALLAVLWFARIVRRCSITSALLFIVLSGLDVVGQLIFAEQGYGPTAHLEWWAGEATLQYTSNTSLLFWVPQHALAGWILTGLVVDGARNENCVRLAVFALALAPLWSLFVPLGLAPFVAAAVLRCGWRRALSFANLVAAPVLLVVGVLFLASRSDPVPQGWWWDQPGATSEWPRLAAFYVLEWGGFAVLCRPNLPGGDRLWWRIAIAILVALPLYRIGLFNDLAMRASIPALFVLWSLVAATVQRSPRTIRGFLLLVLVCVGAFTPANEIIRALSRYRWGTPDVDERPLLAQDPLFRSYLGDGDSWFFRNLARPLRQVVTIEAEHPRRTDGALRTEPAEEASDGRVLVLDADAEVALTYGFELERPVRATTLIARYRSAHSASFDLNIDGASEGRLFLAPSSGAWRFASTKLSRELGAGWHELGLRAPAARYELDVFVLAEVGS